MTTRHSNVVLPEQIEASSQPSLMEKLRNLRWGELTIESLIHAAGLSTIVIVGLIFFFLLREGLPDRGQGLRVLGERPLRHVEDVGRPDRDALLRRAVGVPGISPG